MPAALALTANLNNTTPPPRCAALPHLPEARGAQAVAVEAAANLLAVGEDEQGGAVPALLQALVVLIKVNHLRPKVGFGQWTIRLKEKDPLGAGKANHLQLLMGGKQGQSKPIST